MKEEFKGIDIVPAIFIRYREDGNVLLKCLQGEETVNRAFEARMFKEFKDIKYVLLGIRTGVNSMTLNICDGSEWENLYRDKWSALLKD